MWGGGGSEGGRGELSHRWVRVVWSRRADAMPAAPGRSGPLDGRDRRRVQLIT